MDRSGQIMGFCGLSTGATPARRACPLVCHASSSDVVIVGSGIGGLAAGVALRKATNKSVAVLERSGGEDITDGTSISVWPNAWVALEALDRDACERLRSGKVLVESGKVVKASGKVISSWSFEQVWKGFELRAVPRQEIISELSTLATELGVDIRYNTSVEGVDPWSSTIYVEDGSTIKAGIIVGADGAGSRVRSSVLKDGSPNVSPLVAYRGIVEETAISTSQALQVWDDSSPVRFGSVPITEDKMYWFVTAPGTAPRGTSFVTSEEPLQLLDNFPEDVRDLVNKSKKIYRNGVVDRLPSLKWGEETVTLLGDAAHPMAPNLGQGAAAALEDALALASALQWGADDPNWTEKALRAYERSRLKRVSIIQLRSRGVSTLAHWDSPLPAGLISVAFFPPLVFNHCKYTPPLKLP
uniref:FAD-binding domain-containing protein n=1 Tax=Rhodosorus marinus TaxID=101924 RepID=A0A7S0BN87_9RHOD|mmetsp:Transcript_24760/g.35667  ORF Transcript_24760/g.35667 Transcript_24760/m.35667 type:complete len:414 (+) Transcript_24760:142-1383(+)